MDAAGLAAEYGLKGKINIICLAAFFELAGVLPVDRSIQLLREAINRPVEDGMFAVYISHEPIIKTVLKVRHALHCQVFGEIFFPK